MFYPVAHIFKRANKWSGRFHVFFVVNVINDEM